MAEGPNPHVGPYIGEVPLSGAARLHAALCLGIENQFFLLIPGLAEIRAHNGSQAGRMVAVNIAGEHPSIWQDEWYRDLPSDAGRGRFCPVSCLGRTPRDVDRKILFSSPVVVVGPEQGQETAIVRTWTVAAAAWPCRRAGSFRETTSGRAASPADRSGHGWVSVHRSKSWETLPTDTAQIEKCGHDILQLNQTIIAGPGCGSAAVSFPWGRSLPGGKSQSRGPVITLSTLSK